MNDTRFQPGFRLSSLDVVVLIVGGVTSTYVMTFDRWLGIAIIYVILHFFLFCNVVRMSRRLELTWAGVFSSIAVATISHSLVPWPITFAISSCVTVVVVFIEMRGPSYHGVGWQRLNPNLPKWWESHH